MARLRREPPGSGGEAWCLRRSFGSPRTESRGKRRYSECTYTCVIDRQLSPPAALLHTDGCSFSHSFFFFFQFSSSSRVYLRQHYHHAVSVQIPRLAQRAVRTLNGRKRECIHLPLCTRIFLSTCLSVNLPLRSREELHLVDTDFSLSFCTGSQLAS